MTSAIPLFHLAFPVSDLGKARQFYGQLLGCPEGRSSPNWVDFNFYGHQIVAHLSPNECTAVSTSKVDHEDVPVRHFGAILPMADWQILGRQIAYRWHEIHHRATNQIPGHGGRASHHVFS